MLDSLKTGNQTTQIYDSTEMIKEPRNSAKDPIHQQLRLYKQKQGLGPELEQLSNTGLKLGCKLLK